MVEDRPPEAETRELHERRYMVKLGLRIRAIREERGLTQQAVARSAGIATDMVSRLENGHYTSPGLRTLLLNKYYVDEAYDAVIVQPLKTTSDTVLWKVVDAGAIDGAVNGVAESVGGLSQMLRRIQTGSVRAYAASLLFGAVLVFGYFLWR